MSFLINAYNEIDSITDKQIYDFIYEVPYPFLSMLVNDFNKANQILREREREFKREREKEKEKS